MLSWCDFFYFFCSGRNGSKRRTWNLRKQRTHRATREERQTGEVFMGWICIVQAHGNIFTTFTFNLLVCVREWKGTLAVLVPWDLQAHRDLKATLVLLVHLPQVRTFTLTEQKSSQEKKNLEDSERMFSQRMNLHPFRRDWFACESALHLLTETVKNCAAD